MKGAQALIETLVAGGIDMCFANPGTSEMQFVAALDNVPEIRGVLALFEGVATGAADGYARIAGRPAAALLHLGPGLGNGWANLHNARRANVPVVVIVGDHATYHKKYDPPLESDIDAVAGAVAAWVRRSAGPADVGADAADAIAASQHGGQVAVLILPADVSWTEGGLPGVITPKPDAALHDPDLLGTDEAAAILAANGKHTVILIGGDATTAAGLAAAVRIGQATGATIRCETFPTRLRRGAGVAFVDRVPYFVTADKLPFPDATQMILAGARSPVRFFAYEGEHSDLVPEGCGVEVLAGHWGAQDALIALADKVAPGVVAVTVSPPAAKPLPTGALDAAKAAEVIGALLPENAIVVDEANTSAAKLPTETADAAAHDWLALTGGAIGFGLPVATGAAIAAPDRKVLSLESDGSAMYTISALWTQARERLDVTTLIYNNGAYAILAGEFEHVVTRNSGQHLGPKSLNLIALKPPAIDFAKLAEGMGVPASRVGTAEELADALRAAFSTPGPHLIDAAILLPSA